MMILDQFGLRRARSFALEQAITIQCVSGDLRWALAELAARTTLRWWYADKRAWPCCFDTRRAVPGQGPRFMPPVTAADTMVAAGGR
jgi:hypothetical protein